MELVVLVVVETMVVVGAVVVGSIEEVVKDDFVVVVSGAEVVVVEAGTAVVMELLVKLTLVAKLVLVVFADERLLTEVEFTVTCEAVVEVKFLESAEVVVATIDEFVEVCAATEVKTKVGTDVFDEVRLVVRTVLVGTEIFCDVTGVIVAVKLEPDNVELVEL